MKQLQSNLSFNVLSQDEIKQIHEATLKVLEETGVKVLEPEVRSLLQGIGAKIDGEIAYISPKLVENALKTAPKSVQVYSRDGSPGIVLEEGKSWFGTGSDCPFIMDSRTGERRPSNKKDVQELALLCDALPNIEFVMSLCIVLDVPPRHSDVHQFEAMITNTMKPIVFTAHDKRGMEHIIKIAEAAMGADKFKDHPSICLYAEPISPLEHVPVAMEKMLLAAERKIPVVYTPCPMAGATAPATMAGTLVTGNAEVLSGLVIHQAKNPGAPFIAGGVMTILDMGTANISYGAPELHLLCSAYTQIAHHYGLPMFGTAGCTDAKVLDQQAAIEATASVLVQALVGANLIHDVGFLEYALTGSFEMVAMTDEVVGMVRRITRGIEVNAETLAVDVIKKVGPAGHFLNEDHTFEHFRRETWFPTIIDRNNRERWEAAGSKTLGEKLNEKVLDILATHKPQPLPDSAISQIKAVVESYEKEVRA
jgi:trimethylamine--corrinoid protein Co-methyltransferase